jgi:hypothetical protein
MTPEQVADLHFGGVADRFHRREAARSRCTCHRARDPEGGSVDLYNECRLLAVVLKGSQIAFDFSTGTGGSVQVLFREIRGLRVEQPRDWAPGESDQIEHLLIRREGPWPRVVFNAGGLKYEFDAAELLLVRGQTG